MSIALGLEELRSTRKIFNFLKNKGHIVTFHFEERCYRDGLDPYTVKDTIEFGERFWFILEDGCIIMKHKLGRVIVVAKSDDGRLYKYITVFLSKSFNDCRVLGGIITPHGTHAKDSEYQTFIFSEG